MSSLRSTNYPPQREATKPPDGFGKSMHGDSLKPGDTVYGPAPVENDRGEVSVLNKHWGVVVSSTQEGVFVAYSTSEKSYNIAHSQSFSAEDKGLSNGMDKDGHWSRSDFYVVPGELLERRGYVSDATWDKIQDAAASALQGKSNTYVPQLERDGSLTNTRGRDAGEWSGMGQAMAQSNAARREVEVTQSVRDPLQEALDKRVAEAQQEAVGVIQELLKIDGSPPNYTYSGKEAAQLAERIDQAPDGAIVVITPQDKLRIVETQAGMDKVKGWEAMTVADAKELIQSEVTRVKGEFHAEQSLQQAGGAHENHVESRTSQAEPSAERSDEVHVERER